jgi:hypothetical protein
MTVSARDHAHDDLLGTDAPERVRPRPPWWVLVAACAAALLMGGLVVQLSRTRTEAVVTEDLSGSLHVEDFRTTTADLPFADQQERDGTAAGVVRLVLPGRELRGTAQLTDFSASFAGDDAQGYFHAWGTVSLVLGSNTCRGSFGWSNFSPPDGGGSMHARCEDGATLAATMVATPQLPGPQGVSIDLRDGWYVAGPVDPERPDPRPGDLPQSGY